MELQKSQEPASPSLSSDGIALFKRLNEKRQQVKRTCNILVYGDAGVGKSHLISTYPPPGKILVDLFDPEGCNLPPLRKLEEEGRLAIDDFSSDGGIEKYESSFNTKKKGGLFEEIDLYVIDSLGPMTHKRLRSIWKQTEAWEKHKTPKVSASLQDYNILTEATYDWLDAVLALPCSVMVMAHVAQTKDELTGAIISSILLPGQLGRKALPYFSEVWYMYTRETPQGVSRFLQTVNDGKYKARTRIGSGTFKAQEVPDLGSLFKRAGLL